MSLRWKEEEKGEGGKASVKGTIPKAVKRSSSNLRDVVHSSTRPPETGKEWKRKKGSQRWMKKKKKQR